MSTRAPQRAHTFAPLLALASGAFAIGASQGGSGGVVVDQAADLGTSVEVIGLTIAAYAFGVVVCAPILTVALATWDRRRILLAMAALGVVTSIATALAPSAGWLLPIRFLAAVPHGVFLAAGSVVGAAVLGRERRGRAMALMMTGFTVAIVVAVPLMTWAAAAIGWRWSYAGVAAAFAASYALVARSVPSVPADRGPTGVARAWRTDVAHLRGATVWSAIAFCAVGFAGFSAVFTYVVPILREVNGLTVPAVTLVLSASGIFMTAGTLIAGRITDVSPVRAARLGAAIGIVALVGVGLWGANPVTMIALAFALNASVALMSQGAQTHFMDVIHASPMLGVALSHASINMANGLGAALGAAVIAAGFGYLATAWVGLAAGIVGMLMLMVAPGFRSSAVRSGAERPAPDAVAR